MVFTLLDLAPLTLFFSLSPLSSLSSLSSIIVLPEREVEDVFIYEGFPSYSELIRVDADKAVVY